MHVKFAAVVDHAKGSTVIEDENEIDLDDDEDEEEDEDIILLEKKTRFLALDKCMPHRHFLQVLNIGHQEKDNQSMELTYDEEWLAIVRATHALMPMSRHFDVEAFDQALKAVDLASHRDFVKGIDLAIPRNFSVSAPVHDPQSRTLSKAQRGNPQCDVFFDLLGLAHEKGATRPFEGGVQ